jgi:hypothetical protein
MNEFEPRIVAFLCHWCTYTGADLAGTTRQQYPPNIRIIHLMCSGAVDTIYVLKALMDGADGTTRRETIRPEDGWRLSRVFSLNLDTIQTVSGSAGSVPVKVDFLLTQ